MQPEFRIGQQIGFGNPYGTGTGETPRAEGQNVGLLFAREELPAERPSGADDAVHDHAAFACAPNGRLQHPDPRLAQPFDLRNAHRPVMDKLHAWLEAQLAERKTEPNSGLGQAIGYLLRHWK